MARAACSRLPARISCRSRRSWPGSPRRRLPPNPKVDWDAWVADYGKVREAIAETYPENFHDFNARMWQPGGFHRPLAARRARVEDQDRQGEFHRSRRASRRIPTMPRRPRRVAADHAAQQRSVQHHDLWLQRPLPRHPRHAAGGADAPQRHRPARAARRRTGLPRDRGRRRSRPRGSAGSLSSPTTSPRAAAPAITRNAMCWCRCGTMPNAPRCRRPSRCRSASSGTQRHRQNRLRRRTWCRDIRCRTRAATWQSWAAWR